MPGEYFTEDGKVLTNKADSTKKITVEYTGNQVICKTIQVLKNGRVYLSDCTVNNEKTDYTYSNFIPITSIDVTYNTCNSDDITTCTPTVNIYPTNATFKTLKFTLDSVVRCGNNLSTDNYVTIDSNTGMVTKKTIVW